MLKEEIKEFLEDINLITDESDLQETFKQVSGKDLSRERILKNVIAYLIGNVYRWIECDEINQDQDRELSFTIQQLVDIRQTDFISDYELELSINESLSIIAGIFGLNPIFIKQVKE